MRDQRKAVLEDTADGSASQPRTASSQGIQQEAQLYVRTRRSLLTLTRRVQPLTTAKKGYMHLRNCVSTRLRSHLQTQLLYTLVMIQGSSNWNLMNRLCGRDARFIRANQRLPFRSRFSVLGGQ